MRIFGQIKLLSLSLFSVTIVCASLPVSGQAAPPNEPPQQQVSQQQLLEKMNTLQAEVDELKALPKVSAASLPARQLFAPVKLGGFTIPSTSIERSADVGRRFHTNYLISNSKISHATGQAQGIPYGVLPEQLREIYKIPASADGADAIAIVDAFDYPTALADFNAYSVAAGIPQETSKDPTSPSNTVFQMVYADGNKPGIDTVWNGEEALDVEIAHAIAPKAKIFLVVAKDDSTESLFQAVRKAATLPHVKEISMSWSGSEYDTQAAETGNSLSAKGIIYLGATGDSGAGTGLAYPAASPNVIAVGGTSLQFDQNGKLCLEVGWSGSGGGPSRFEKLPEYQIGVKNIAGEVRCFPDISTDADPASGVGIYQNGTWLVIGGTSLACPVMAAIINDAKPQIVDTATELKKIYDNAVKFRDITIGSNGFSADVGYDLVTGLGVPQGLGGF